MPKNGQSACCNSLRGTHSHEPQTGEPALVTQGCIEVILESRIAPPGSTGKNALLALYLDTGIVGHDLRLARFGGGFQELIERVDGRGLR